MQYDYSLLKYPEITVSLGGLVLPYYTTRRFGIQNIDFLVRQSDTGGAVGAFMIRLAVRLCLCAVKKKRHFFLCAASDLLRCDQSKYVHVTSACFQGIPLSLILYLMKFPLISITLLLVAGECHEKNPC